MSEIPRIAPTHAPPAIRPVQPVRKGARDRGRSRRDPGPDDHDEERSSAPDDPPEDAVRPEHVDLRV
jgi:hypothetical protein